MLRMIKREQKSTPAVLKWYLSVIKTSSPLEIKSTRGKYYFATRELKQHQRDYLLSATTKRGFAYKIPDTDRMFQPFDVVMYRDTPAYVAICYPDITCLIEIRELLKIKGASLLETKARKIAYKILEK